MSPVGIGSDAMTGSMIEQSTLTYTFNTQCTYFIGPFEFIPTTSESAKAFGMLRYFTLVR